MTKPLPATVTHRSTLTAAAIAEQLTINLLGQELAALDFDRLTDEGQRLAWRRYQHHTLAVDYWRQRLAQTE